MQQLVGFALTASLSVGICGQVRAADTWCHTNFPNAVFCDDFDRYCLNPPPAPGACPSGSTGDGDAFNRNWVPTGQCSNSMAMDDTFYSSPPYGGRTNCQDKSILGYSRSAISDEIRAYYNDAYSAVMGTDLNPLILEVTMHGQAFNKAIYGNSFISFGQGLVSAPADWAYSDWCSSCGSPDPRYPIICQQETPAPACPPISQAPHVTAIAVGFVAYLDSNPCHCNQAGDHSPYNEHLSFFDGYKWYRLRQGLFPGSGDFRVRSYQNRIKITISSTMLKVELTCPTHNEYSWCELPRDYMGCFSSFTVGYPTPCRLKSGSWVCTDDPSCVTGVPGGGVPSYDNIVVYGGVGCGPTGACCLPTSPDYTCVQAYDGDCQTMGGVFRGHGVGCDDVSCCPPLPADHDVDGDVDMEDFGWFQTCLSGPQVPPPTFACKCADFDSQGDVDQDDFSIFQRCLSGSDVSADPNCLN